MSKRSYPHRGSLAYVPMVRAKNEVPHVKSWADGGDKPKVMGYAGYKAGMTHAFIVDYRKTSGTSGEEVRIPVTIVETPPMKVVAIRAYEMDIDGLKVVSEVWAKTLDKELGKRLQTPKKYDAKDAWKKIKAADVEEIRVIMQTTPSMITGIPKKVPDLLEQPVKGGTIDEQLDYAKKILGKELSINDFTQTGSMLDIIAVTKGKGFQGVVKRKGVKLLTHKNSKHRRLIGTRGPWHPAFVMWQVPQAGQTGYHQRTEYNKRVIKIGDIKEDDATPKGGFIKYGNLRNDYLIVHGSIPGPSKRLIRLRDAIRFKGDLVDTVEMTYLSKESKQGK